MRVLIQDRETRKYYLKRRNEWISNAARATDFVDLYRALVVAREIKDKKTEVVLLHSDGHSEVHYPVS